MEKETDDLMDGVDETEETSSSAPQEEASDNELSEDDSSSTGARTDPEHPDEENETEPGADALEDGEKEQPDEKSEFPDGEEGILGEDGKLLEEDIPLEAGGSTPQMTADEVKEAVYGALEDFFTEEMVLSVAVQEEEKGLYTPLEELGLTDILLLAVLLVILGRAVCDIIGGKNRWRK